MCICLCTSLFLSFALRSCAQPHPKPFTSLPDAAADGHHLHQEEPQVLSTSIWPLNLELSVLPRAAVWPIPDSPMTQQNTSRGCHCSRRRSNVAARCGWRGAATFQKRLQQGESLGRSLPTHTHAHAHTHTHTPTPDSCYSKNRPTARSREGSLFGVPQVRFILSTLKGCRDKDRKRLRVQVYMGGGQGSIRDQ